MRGVPWILWTRLSSRWRMKKPHPSRSAPSTGQQSRDFQRPLHQRSSHNLASAPDILQGRVCKLLTYLKLCECRRGAPIPEGCQSGSIRTNNGERDKLHTEYIRSPCRHHHVSTALPVIYAYASSLADYKVMANREMAH